VKNEVEHPPVLWRCRWRGCVQQERLHQQCFAHTRQTGAVAMALYNIGDFGAADYSLLMSSGRHSQRTVGLVAIVEVDSDG
jgi:hypothetical protein